MSIRDFLKQFTLEDVIKNESSYKIVLVAQHNDTMKKTIECFNDKKIHSMPVQGQDRQIIGMIDYLDAVTFLVSKFPQDKRDLNDVKLLDAAYQDTLAAKVSEVANFSGRNPYQALKYTDHATKVIHYFASGYHRVPLQDDTGDLVMTISQSTFLKFCAPFLEKELVGQKTVEELRLGLVKPISIKEDDFILDALLAISKHKVNAIAVVRDDNKLVGNFSSSDVRSFQRDHMPTFTLDAKDWLASHSPHSLKLKTVHPWSTLAEITKILSSGVHCVWVVNKEGHPTGIVSQTDVIKVIEQL